MILKAGTYLFNNTLLIGDTVELTVDIIFTSKIVDAENGFEANINCTSMFFKGASAEGNIFGAPIMMYEGITSDVEIPEEYVGNGVTFVYVNQFVRESLRTVTFATDQTVNDDFGNLFIANTNYNEVNPPETTPLATIEYNGQVIASLNAGETATLSCAGKKMASDIVVAVEGGGECSGEHVITVEELPTESIDKKSIYKMETVFSDVVLRYAAYNLLVPLFSELGGEAYFYKVPTKPVDNIQVTDFDNGLIHVYLVEDENELFVYGNPEETGTNSWIALGTMMGIDVPFQGTISDISQATEDGYYVLAGDQYYKYLDALLIDVALNDGASANSLGEEMSGMYYVSTKPIENIKVCDLDNEVYYLYYVEAENDILMYGDIENTGTNTWFSVSKMLNDAYSFQGVITDISQATSTGYYAIITEAGLYRLIFEKDVPTPTAEERTVTPATYSQTITPNNADYLSKVTVNPIPSGYVYVSGTKSITTEGTYDVRYYSEVNVSITSGTLSIDKNGTYDVTTKKSVDVNIPTVYISESLSNIPENAVEGSVALIWEVYE